MGWATNVLSEHCAAISVFCRLCCLGSSSHDYGLLRWLACSLFFRLMCFGLVGLEGWFGLV